MAIETQMKMVASQAMNAAYRSVTCTDVMVIIVDRNTGEHQIASNPGTTPNDAIIVLERTLSAVREFKDKQGREPTKKFQLLTE